MSTDKRQPVDLTDEADPLHQKSIRPFPSDASEREHGGRGRSSRESRRHFLAKVGAGSAALGVASFSSPITRFMPTAGAQADRLDDGSLIKFLMTVEYAAVEAYNLALSGGKLSAPLATIAEAFAGDHQEHGDGFAKMITAADGDKVPNPKVLVDFRPRLTAAANERAVLQVLYNLEETLAATDLSAIGELYSKPNAGVVATVLPVESQHAVVMARFIDLPIGQYMPPFETQKLSLDPAAFAS